MPSERQRVLIVNVPDMLSELLVAELASASEFDALTIKKEAQLLASIGRFRPHVVIAGCSEALLSCTSEPLLVYLLDPGASSTRRVELHPVSEDMGDVSLSELVASIKVAGKH